MTLLWIAVIVLTYIIFSKSYNDQKVREFIRNENDAQQTFSISLTNTVLSEPLLQELLGFKDAPKDFSKWKEADKEEWFKAISDIKIEDKLYVRLTHIPLTDIFLVSIKDRTYPVTSEWKKRTLYSETLFGESFSISKPNLSINIVDRFLMDEKLRVLTGYLRYRKGLGEESKTILLFDFPYELGKSDEVLEKFGFAVERDHSDPYSSDLAGFHEPNNEMDMWSHITYKNKKNVEITSFS